MPTNPACWPTEIHLHAMCDRLDLPTQPITTGNVDLAAYARLRPLCLQHQFLPLFAEGIVLQVACTEPWNEANLAGLRRLLEKEVRAIGITEENLEQTLATIESQPGPVAQDPAAPPRANDAVPIAAWEIDLQDTRNGFIRLASQIIEQAHLRNASDIHLEPMEDRLRIRFRLDNDLEVMPPVEKVYAAKVIEAFKIKANIPTAEIAIEQRGRIAEHTAIGPLDLRVQVTPTLHGQAVVCRLLDPRSLAAVAGRLPFVGKTLETIRAVVEGCQGMLLLTGPTGSGKSTTLLKIITSLDRARLKIVTIEEPVEYALDGIPQTDVSAGRLSFATALKADLRNDPDVILVGEIRDLETAKIGIQAAQTGHLLLSTLHTNNTTETISRLLTLGCDPTEVSSSLACVVAQRLVKRLCPSCKVPLPTPPKAVRLFHAYGLPVPATVFGQKGCVHCRSEGTRGRLPVFELLHLDDSLKARISTDFDPQAFREAWRQQGGETLGMHGLRLLADGEVDLRELDCLTAEMLPKTCSHGD